MNFIYIYVLIGFVYGWYSCMMQYFRHPMFCHWKTMLEVYFMNAIIWPASIIIAVTKNTLIPWNLLKALKEQGPFKRAFKNFFITGNAWGLFHVNSHIRQDTQKSKVMYNTKESAIKAAESMSSKKGVHFSTYKCAFCDGYHIGKNRDNKK